MGLLSGSYVSSIILVVMFWNSILCEIGMKNFSNTKLRIYSKFFPYELDVVFSCLKPWTKT